MSTMDVIIRIGAEMTPEGQAAIKGMGAQLKGMALQSVKAINRAMTGAGIATGFAMRNGIEDYKELSKKMAEVSTLIDDQGINIKDLEDQIVSISKETGKDPLGLAQALYDSISAGMEAGKAIEFVGTSTKASIAGIAETADTVNLFTNVLNNYRSKSLETMRVSDVMFQTIKLGKTTMPELAQNLGQVLPFASKLNVSIEEIGGAMATLTKGTGDTVMSSTWLKNILAGVLKPSEDMQMAVEALGYESAASAVKSEGLNVFLNKLYKHVNGNEEAIGALFPSIRSLAGVLTLTGDNAGEFAENTQKMNTAMGSTEEALAKIKMDESFKFDKSLNELKLFTMEISKELLPALASLMKAAAEFVKENPTLVKSFMAVAAATAAVNLSGMVPLLGSFGKFVLLVPKVVAGLKSIEAVQAAGMMASGGKFALGGLLKGKILSGGAAVLGTNAALAAGTAYLGYKGGQVIGDISGANDSWKNYYTQQAQIAGNRSMVENFYSDSAQDRLTQIQKNLHPERFQKDGEATTAAIEQGRVQAVEGYKSGQRRQSIKQDSDAAKNYEMGVE